MKEFAIKRKILITGAHGFTGKHFIRSLNPEDWTPICLTSNINDYEGLEKEILEISPDMVLHLAGISFVASKDLAAFYRVHVEGTNNLLKSLVKLDKKPFKILLTSSATVYGNPEVIPTPETFSLDPIDDYAQSKVEMENIAKNYMGLLSIVIARPFNYTGQGQKNAFLIPKIVQHFAKNSPTIELGNLNIEREFNDVSVICDAYLKLLLYGVPGEIYNVSSGHLRSLYQIIEMLTKLTGHDIKVVVNPEFIRKKDVMRMSGDPSKLLTLLSENNLQLKTSRLEDTLQAMLDSYN